MLFFRCNPYSRITHAKNLNFRMKYLTLFQIFLYLDDNYSMLFIYLLTYHSIKQTYFLLCMKLRTWYCEKMVEKFWKELIIENIKNSNNITLFINYRIKYSKTFWMHFFSWYGWLLHDDFPARNEFMCYLYVQL